MNTRQVLIGAASLLVIAASLWFTWTHQISRPTFNAALHQGVGELLAEQTTRVVGDAGQITVITMDAGDSAIVAAQFRAFKMALEKSGDISIRKLVVIDSKKADSYGPGYGLSARKLAREVKKHPEVDALVSFVGLPALDDAELKELGQPVPPMVAFARDGRKLGALAAQGILKAAVVPRYRFPAPGPDQPRTPREWVVQKYQLIASVPLQR